MKLTIKDATALIIKALTDDEAGRLSKMMITAALGEEPDTADMSTALSIAWKAVSHDMHVSAARAEAGRKGAEVTNNAEKPAEEPVQKPVRLTAGAEKKAKKEALQERFAAFWAAYPRHTAKQNALKSFEKIAPDDALLNEMLNALDRQKQSSQWTRDNGQYIPHPATWLNQRRWEDEMTTVQARQSHVGERYSNPFADLAAEVG